LYTGVLRNEFMTMKIDENEEMMNRQEENNKQKKKSKVLQRYCFLAKDQASCGP
jgi:hypothetical protein